LFVLSYTIYEDSLVLSYSLMLLQYWMGCLKLNKCHQQRVQVF